MSDPHDTPPLVGAVNYKGAPPTNTLVTAAFIGMTIVVLYLGAGIFVPLVLAVLLAFALAPVVHRLRRLHLPHIVAVLLAVLLAGAVLSTIGYIVATQLIKLAGDLPRYQTTVVEKFTALQQTLGGEGGTGFLSSFGDAIGQLQGQLEAADGAETTRPMPVVITNDAAGPLAMVQSVLSSVLGPLTTAAIVAVFLIFLLLEREDLRDRFLKLVSRGDLRTSTKVMNEAAARVGRYLLVQFCVNLSYGVVYGTGLSLIGVPNAVLWGLLAAIFRYIPFVGTLIASSIPFTLAFAVDPGWSMLLYSVALFATLELVTTNAIEPRLYGSSTGLSPLAVLVAAMFWATLWGPIGLILSTPITVCLVVLGRYVPQLQFFETLLGSEPVLEPTERFYQRLVAGNTVEAIELAEEYVGEHDLQRFYQEIAMPALRLAEADLDTNANDVAHRRRVVESLSGVVDDLDDDLGRHAVEAEKPQVLCIGGRTELDGSAALLLGRLLETEYAISVMPPLAVRQESIGQLDLEGVRVVCLCYLGESMRSYLRYVARRLHRRQPGLVVIACVFNDDMATAEAGELNVDMVARNIEEAATAVRVEMAEPEGGTPALEATDPLGAAADMAWIRQLARPEGPVAERLREIAVTMEVPVAVVDLRQDEAGGSNGSSTPATPHGASTVAALAMSTGEVVVVTDVRSDARFSADPALLENGIGFCVSVPLVGGDGEIVGALSLLDQEARSSFGAEDAEKLSLLALHLMQDAANGHLAVASGSGKGPDEGSKSH
ncbi:AI-2E family transporter [Devosia sp. 1635]|uniref:AI-2E family transporter n=1 Tax=Devosia sp. 1635 TaxID=2726066 RepID=UPI001565D623|nr:AI-2E family transporter [Devosia sp. 1635]